MYKQWCVHTVHIWSDLIILGSCWTEKIENMIFQPVWRSRSRIKIYILWNHTFYVFLLGKYFQAASYHGHRIDMILITKSNFMKTIQTMAMGNILWGFNISHCPLYLPWYLLFYLQISHIQLHPFIQWYNSKEWITLDIYDWV